jgi:ribose 5-phosphate isomerase A
MGLGKPAEEFIACYIKEGSVVAVGTSALGEKFVKRLALVIEEKGTKVQIVPSSNRLAAISASFGLPLASINDTEIDVAIEFVSQADPDFNFIKSNSHSLVRDKMIAQSSSLLFTVLDEANFVKKMNCEMQCEIAAFGWKRTINQLDQLGKAWLEKNGKEPMRSETGNFFAKIKIDSIYDMQDLDHQLKEIPGVIETGIFLGYADKLVLMGEKEIKIKSRPGLK